MCVCVCDVCTYVCIFVREYVHAIEYTCMCIHVGFNRLIIYNINLYIDKYIQLCHVKKLQAHKFDML